MMKPCPFCGTTPTMEHSNGAGQVWCSKEGCDLVGFVDSDSPYLDDLLKKWNTRSGESELEDSLEKRDDLLHELGENLKASEDQNHYYQLAMEFRDKAFALKKYVTCHKIHGNHSHYHCTDCGYKWDDWNTGE